MEENKIKENPAALRLPDGPLAEWEPT